MEPKVSVLMAAYNRADLIQFGIESFLRQSYPNVELIICDDCSTDNTLDVVRAYAARHHTIKWYKNEVNKKFVPTVNWMFSVADGDYICLLDSDDEMAEDRVAHQLGILQRYGADAVISELARINKDGGLVPNPPRATEPFRIVPDSKDVHFPSGSIMMHRKVVEKVKGYHPYFADAFCGDIYMINSIATDFKLMYDPRCLYHYRLTEGSMTQTFDLYTLSKLALARFLIEQRKQTGTDYLEQGDMEALEAKRLQILNDKKWQAEQYRIYAARAIDDGRREEALKMITRSLTLNPFSSMTCKTALYYLRKVRERRVAP